MLMHSICFTLCHLLGLFSVDGGKERRREKTSCLAQFLWTHGCLLAKYWWKGSCPFGTEHREPQGKNRFPQTKPEKREYCSCCRFVINKQFEILVSPTSSHNRLKFKNGKEKKASFNYYTSPTTANLKANDRAMKHDKTIFLRANYSQYILSSLHYAFVKYTPLSYINSENFVTNIF